VVKRQTQVEGTTGKALPSLKNQGDGYGAKACEVRIPPPRDLLNEPQQKNQGVPRFSPAPHSGRGRVTGRKVLPHLDGAVRPEMQCEAVTNPTGGKELQR
jgi:hypothetical protein